VCERHTHELKRNGPHRAQCCQWVATPGQPTASGDVRSKIGDRSPVPHLEQ
jgi:hypothetical protein